LAGDPRWLGSAPDQGAYEHASPPAPPHKPKVATPSIHKKSAHAVHVIEKVNPEGLSTKVELVVMRHGKTVKSKTVSAGSGHSGKLLRVGFSGLKKKATYRIHAVATSSAGHATSKTRKVKTK
jgi:ribosomal protein L3